MPASAPLFARQIGDRAAATITASGIVFLQVATTVCRPRTLLVGNRPLR
jgi:hypothetical protein